MSTGISRFASSLVEMCLILSKDDDIHCIIWMPEDACKQHFDATIGILYSSLQKTWTCEIQPLSTAVLHYYTNSGLPEVMSLLLLPF